MAKNDNKSVFSSGWTRRGLVAAAVVGAAALSTLSAPVLAGSTWDGLKGDVFGQRRIENGLGIMTLKAPVRPEDQRAVPVDIEARFADGRTVKSVTLATTPSL